MRKIKVLVIVGLTASGKSDLAVEIARKFNGEVISADSRQVYKGLDIATGKITKTEMKNVPHYLLDVISPKKTFTAADFVEHGRTAIEDIHSRSKLPIVAGGTMFYVDALIGDVEIPSVEPDEDLREELEKEDAETLLKRLAKLDSKRAEHFKKDGQDLNKRRIIRSIEIASSCGSVPNSSSERKYEILKIGIKTNKDTLQERIRLRTHKRIKCGMIAEARKLHEKGLSYKRMRQLGLEYKHLADFLQGKIDKEELARRIERDDWRYARKQMSWWKRDKEIHWVELNDEKKIQKLVESFLK